MRLLRELGRPSTLPAPNVQALHNLKQKYRRTNHANDAICRQEFFHALIYLRHIKPEDQVRATARDATQTPADPMGGADRENSSNKTNLYRQAEYSAN